MIGYELRLQMTNRRSWLLLAAIVLAVLGLFLVDHVVAQAGLAVVTGFDFLKGASSLVFFVLIPILILFDGVHHMGREYSERTLATLAFAGMSRPLIVRAKLATLFVRAVIYTAVAAVLALALAERFGMDRYRLYQGFIDRDQMYLRFLWAAAHSLLYVTAYASLTTGLVVLLGGRRFETIALCVMIFLLVLFTGGSRTAFPSWWICGAPSELFENLEINAAVRGPLLTGEVFLAILDGFLFIVAQILFRRQDIVLRGSS